MIIAFLILSLIYWNYLKIKINKRFEIRINPIIPFLFLLFIFIQIAIGAFVSGMDAEKIYNSWLLMGNIYFPNDNEWINLFKLKAFSDPSLVQFMHRNLAYLILLFYSFVL